MEERRAGLWYSEVVCSQKLRGVAKCVRGGCPRAGDGAPTAPAVMTFVRLRGGRCLASEALHCRERAPCLEHRRQSRPSSQDAAKGPLRSKRVGRAPQTAIFLSVCFFPLFGQVSPSLEASNRYLVSKHLLCLADWCLALLFCG